MADLITIQTRSDLVRQIIDYISSRYPTADLSPGLVLRDLLVEGPMDYLANTSVIASLIGQVLDLNSLAELVGNSATKLTYAQAFNISATDFDSTLKNVIELYASNYNLSRKLGSKSNGVLTFYSVTAPANDIVIPAGTQCKIPNTQIIMKTLKTVTLPKPANSTPTNPLLYDTVNNRYYINVTAECLTTGGIGNVPSNSVSTFAGAAITGLSGVGNQQPFIGGVDPETDAELVGRLKLVYTGNFKGTAPSIVSSVLAFDFIKDATIAYLWDDINKVRSGMNTIDLFVQGGKLISAGASVTVDTPSHFALPNAYVSQLNSLLGPVTTPASGSYIYPYFAYQISYGANGESTVSFNFIDAPRFTVTDYSPSGTTAYKRAIVYAQLKYLAGTTTLDTAASTPQALPDFVNNAYLPADGRIQIYREIGGVQQNDTVNWRYLKYTPSGPQELMRNVDASFPSSSTLKYYIYIQPKINDVLTVDSVYNSAIGDIQSYVSNPANLFVGQDILAYPATSVSIVADIRIQIDQAYTETDREGVVKSKFLELIGQVGLGQELNQSFFISEFLKIPGVVDVELPFTKFTRETTRMGSSDIAFSPKEYPVITDAADVIIRATKNPIGL